MPSSSRIASSLFIALCVAGAVFVAAGASSDAPGEGELPTPMIETRVSTACTAAGAAQPGESEAFGTGSEAMELAAWDPLAGLSSPATPQAGIAPSATPLEAQSTDTEQAASPMIAEPAERVSVLASNQVVAFYGKPGAPSMGILGEYSKESIAPLLEGYAKLYDAANGSVGVVPAFYIIYGTCWPGGEIGILNRKVVEDYIRFAADRGWQVFLDHQLGKYGVEDSVRSMLPFLRFPNVHLAIDPEWRTTLPMKEIGWVSGAELNSSQALMQEYLEDNGLPGVRMLVTHQFRASMIRDSGAVRTDFDRVALVHTADGFGPPALKKNTYAWNAKLANMPIKGFKLFFKSAVPGAGSDEPLMRPEEVMALDPLPLVVMYQ